MVILPPPHAVMSPILRTCDPIPCCAPPCAIVVILSVNELATFVLNTSNVLVDDVTFPILLETDFFLVDKMWRSTEPAPLPTPTGAFQPIPPPSTGCSDPAKLKEDPDLAALCSCQAATNSTIALVNTYVGQVEKYNSDLTAYEAATFKLDAYDRCANDGVCLGDYDSYQSEFDNNYKNQQLYTNGAFGCTTANQSLRDEYCKTDYNNGWNYVPGTDVNAYCNSSPPNVGGGACCTNKCQRSITQALKDWKPYFRSRAPEPYVPPPPVIPEFDAQIAITCCSQSFKNIEGDTVKIYDITQQFSAEVNKYITDVENGTLPPSTLPPNYYAPAPGAEPSDEPAPEGLKTFAIVLIIVAVVVFIIMMIWVGVRLRKRSQKKTSAPTPLAPPS